MNDIFNTDVPLKTETTAFAKHVLPAVPSSEVYLEDCVTALKRYADNHFDLAIVDPPYGIDSFKNIKETKNKIKNRFVSGLWNDNYPTELYFKELFRVSKNQIIWGGNYFDLPPTRCYIFWDKMVQVENFADGELAWTSFDKNAKQFRYAWGGLSDGVLGRNKKEKSIHPTQKPIELYAWLLDRYAKPNDLILDTHLGSGSSRIAAYKGGFNFVGFEIDQEYYEKQEKRFNDFKSQLRLF